jgi:hypothetical protein
MKKSLAGCCVFVLGCAGFAAGCTSEDTGSANTGGTSARHTPPIAFFDGIACLLTLLIKLSFF